MVFHSTVSNADLYNNVAPNILRAFLNGYNATVLAYGMTGSGKTYTMGSEANVEDLQSGSLSERDGLIPRFVADIFTMLGERKSSSEKSVMQSPRSGNVQASVASSSSLVDYKVSASFLEVYGEAIHDLLDEDRQSLKLREDSKGEVFVVGLSTVPVINDAEAMGILNTGTMNRTTAATLMNCTSSRSHAVFTINLQQTTRGSEGVDITTTSRLTFVDLAGSERMKKTGAEGERMREGIKINEGLLALGNVINALGDEERLAKGEKVHVPYRQSKLTRLLQDALGGNSQTLFLACVSPSDTNASETISTLQYANRARNIRNAPTRNVDATALELQRLRALTSVLKCELVKQRFHGDSTTMSSNPENERMNESVVDPNDIGVVNEQLMQREDVVAYIHMIEEKVSTLSSSAEFDHALATTPSMMPPITTPSAPNLTSGSMTQLSSVKRFEDLHAISRKKLLSQQSTTQSARREDECSNTERKSSFRGHATLSSVEDFQNDKYEEEDMNGYESTDLDDANPEEDIEIIDELIEIQRRDQKFDQHQKDGEEKILKMEGEIEAQEERLLQLRGHLKVYHNMKEKYESLLNEVDSLESERQILMDKLEKATADPSKGCSIAIKKQLEQVKSSLARARSETRKHQQLYRQAEQEAKKCHVLERKIDELKSARVALIKKQKDDAAKHKENTTLKTNEIKALKRRERNADKKLSKLEAECQRYKTNLERSQSRYDKVSDKLKQTETTLTRLLTKKRHDLNRNTSAGSSRSSSRQGNKTARRNLESDGGEDHFFSPFSEEVRSLIFVIEKTVSDRVTKSQNKDSFQSKIVDHEKLLETMSNEVKLLNKQKRESRQMKPESSDDLQSLIQEHEGNVQDLLIQIELVENDLESMRTKEAMSKVSHREDSTKKMISKLDSPVLRTLIWKLLDSYSASEVRRVFVC